MSKSKKQYGKGSNTYGKRGAKGQDRNDFIPKKDRGMDRNTSSRTTAVDNDLAWYAKNVNMLRDSASIPFSFALGQPLDFKKSQLTTASGGIVRGGNQTLPGIMAINVVPGVGYSRDVLSAVNVAARNIFAYVWKDKSGNPPYDPSDLMLYLLGMDSCYFMHAYLKRAYGLIRTFSAKNRYIGRALIEAMRIDYDDLLANAVQLRLELDIIAEKLNQRRVPNNLYYFQRHAWMFSNVFKDHDQESNFQMYMFNPDIAYKYRGFTSERGGFLDPIPLATYVTPNGTYTKEKFKVRELLNILNDMVETIYQDPDANRMSGDIFKTFENNVYRVQPVEPDYTTPIVYAEEVLTQINNCIAVGHFYPNTDYYTVEPEDRYGTAGTIWVDNDTDGAPIKYFPRFQSPIGVVDGSNRLMNLPFADPKPGDVMIASRLITGSTGSSTYIGDIADNTNHQLFTFAPSSFGAEIVTTVDIVANPNDASGKNIESDSYAYSHYSGAYGQGSGDTPASGITVGQLAANNNIALKTVNFIVGLSRFDWHPPFVVDYTTFAYKSDGSHTLETRVINLPIWETVNVTTLYEDNIRNLHNVAMMSLFNVAEIGNS